MKQFSFFFIVLAFVFRCCAQVVEVTDTNFDQLVKKTDQWVLEFYADWCGYCTQFAPKFDQAEEILRSSSYNTIYFGKINIHGNPALAAQFFVSRLPTLFHIDQRQVRTLPMPRNVNVFVDSLKNQEWSSISPIGGWRSPFGIFGRLVGLTGYFVKKLSTVSPWLVVGLLSGLLVCSLGLTTYFARRPSSLDVGQDSSDSTADQSSSTALNKKSPTTQKRRSKRID
ncbi:unnamed protein product [Absidia cylindrospora]